MPGYVGKYGDALRRLQVLDAQAQGQAVGPMGAQPVTGPIELPSVLNPRYAPDPRAPAFEQAGAVPSAQGGAFAQAAAAQLPQPSVVSDDPRQGGISGNLPKQQSVQSIVKEMSAEERKELAAGIKARTGRTVDELYAEMVRAGEIAPPAERKPKMKEKLPVLAEALLRFAQHMGQPNANPGAASAMATMETQGRRAALEQAAIDEENARAEARRAEVQGVLNARATRAQTLGDKAAERDYEREVATTAAGRASALQSQQDAAALERTKIMAGSSASAQRGPDRLVRPDGVVMERDPVSGIWKPARAITPVTKKGKRGVTTTVDEITDLRVTPKAATGEVTAAVRQRMVNDAMKQIQSDNLTMARIRQAVGDDAEAIAEEVARRARLQVEEALAAGQAFDTDYGDNPLD